MMPIPKDNDLNFAVAHIFCWSTFHPVLLFEMMAYNLMGSFFCRILVEIYIIWVSHIMNPHL